MVARFRLSQEGLLFALLVTMFLMLVYFNHQGSRTLPDTAPTSFNARPVGLKALYLLYDRLGFTVKRLAAPWTRLNQQAALLIVQEPFTSDREVTQREIAALTHWIEQGGIVLYATTLPVRGYDSRDPLSGDLANDAAPNTPSVATIGTDRVNNPFLHNVHQIAVRSPIRLRFRPGAPYVVLLRDAHGNVIVAKQVGKGWFLAVADDLLLNNAGIAQQDNAIFMANVAAQAVGKTNRWILFDEYHHGYGFEVAPEAVQREDIWQALPQPLRLAVIYLVAFGLVIIYNENRRRGPLRSIPLPPALAGADYVIAMGRLLLRAGATDLALQQLYSDFLHTLSASVGTATEVSRDVLLERVARAYQTDVQPLSQLLEKCEQALQKGRPSHEELQRLVRELDYWNRRLQLARIR